MTYELDGEVDLAVAPMIERSLRAHAAETDGDVVVSCRSMTFIDSSGLRALVIIANELELQGRTIRLTEVASACARTFEIAGLTERFEIGST
jgi:anti-anti-sigma factor